MLSRGKVTPATVSYYTDEVAGGLEDYYAGRGEAPGHWMGRGSVEAGLAGEVGAEQLARLFDARHPDTGDPLGSAYRVRDGAERVTGWDLTFSAPKSVSVLWAVGGGAVGLAVREAHDAAVAAGLDYLEDHAAFSRQGKAGIRQVDTEGLVAAAFVHRTSRSGDPQLHTHVLVSGRVRCLDGVWRALDSRALHRELKTAGMTYQAVLRTELTRRLWVTWIAVDRHGQAEIAGVPEQLRRRFSARSRVVEAAAGERIAELEVDLGRSLTPAERRGVYPAAVLSTRKAKDLTGFSDGGLHDRWATTAVEAGLDPERWLRRVVGHRPGLPSVSIDAIVADSVVELSRSQSTWARTDVVRQVLRRTPPNLPVVVDPRRWVERVTDEVLAHPEVVRLAAPEPAPPSDLRRADGLSVFERHGAARYSTRATLATEQHVLDLATAGRGAGRAIAHRVWVEGAIDEAGLGKDQAKAVRRFTLSGDAISCLVGPAGTGKSRAVGAAATAWRHSGTWVLGLAVSATAAGVLRSEAGISTETVAKLLYELDRRDPTWALRPGGVVIVDEAAMVASSDLARLATFVERSGSKLVLVGDHAQLGAVDAGGLFRLLVADGPAELAQVHRFEHSWERSASLGLRNHDPEVVDTYVEHGRVAGGDATAILDAAFDHWQRARALGDSVVVCAGDRATVEALSQRARAARVAAGEVEAGGVEAAGQRIGVGDEVVTCRNDRRLVTTGGGWVRNGDRWTVTARHLDDSLTVEDAAGRGRLRLPADYVGDHISLAYAVTVHKAQGLTVDRAVLIADNRTSAEALYVGMTRGRRSNHALVVCDQELEHRQPSAHPADLLRAATQRQGAERAATDELRHQLGRSDSLAVLGPRLANLDAWIAAEQPPDRSEDLVAVLAVRSRLEQCEPPSRLTRLGRAHRYHVQRLDQQQADLQTSEQERQRWLEDHSETIAYRDGLARSVEERRRQLGADAARLEPDHVVSLLGPRPDQPEDADRWTRRASAIESYREAWGVDPSRITIAPTDRTQRHAWECSIRPLQLEPPSAVRAALDLGIDPPVHRNAEYDHGIDL